MRLQSSVSKHFRYLCILCTDVNQKPLKMRSQTLAILFENKFTLLNFVFVLSLSAVFASLAFVLRHSLLTAKTIAPLKMKPTAGTFPERIAQGVVETK